MLSCGILSLLAVSWEDFIQETEGEQSTEATVTHTLSVQHQERGYNSTGNLMTFCCPGAAISKAGRRGK